MNNSCVVETEKVAEGLFLKNFLGTVSTVPKSRLSYHPDTNYCVDSYCSKEYRTCQSHSVKGRMPDCSKINHCLKEKNVSETNFSKMKEIGIDSPNTSNNGIIISHLNQLENEKKRERKWTLGVFFRKKCKKNEENISDDTEEDLKKNLVNRYKSKREKKKLKAKSTANGFDLIISPKNAEINSKKYEKIAQSSKENDSKNIYRKPVENSSPFVNNAPTRFIHRHPNNYSEDEKINCAKESLQVSKNIKKNPNVTHTSGLNSENLEGRKCRKKVMARAEAKRDMICDDSSSEEYESFQSNSSPGKNVVDHLGTRKPRRNKRLSRNDSFFSKSPNTLMQEKNEDLALIKSDDEFLSNLRKNSSSFRVDQDEEKLSGKNCLKAVNIIGNSQQQQIIDQTEFCQTNSFPIVDFLPKNRTCNSPIKNKLVFVSLNQSYEDQPYISHSFQDNQAFIPNIETNCLGHSKENLNTVVFSNYKNISNSNSFYSSAEKKRDRSFGKEYYLKNCNTDFTHKQPFKEYTQINLNSPSKSQHSFLSSCNSTEPHSVERKIKENELNDFYCHRKMLPIFKNRNSLEKIAADSNTPSVFTETNEQANILQRSGSEHFFEDLKFHNGFEQNRSSSYQNIPNSTHIDNNNFYEKNSLTNEIERKNKVFLDNPKWDSFEFQKETSPNQNHSSSENCIEETTSMLRYYADLNPRSRNPIHITCDPAISSQEFLLNYSQVANKTKDKYLAKQQWQPKASVFWKLKDQSATLEQKNLQNTYKLPKNRGNVKYNILRSNSLNSTTQERASISYNQSFASDQNSIYVNENQFKNFNSENDFKENFEDKSKLLKPPIQTLTQQNVFTRVNNNEELNGQSNNKNEIKNDNSNLNEALIELENICNSLKRKDEDLIIEETKLKQVHVFNENLNKKTEKIFDAKTGVFMENLPVVNTFLNSSIENSHTSLPVNKPDKIHDDMAFRRMNVKDRNNSSNSSSSSVKNFIFPSYLRFSFTAPQPKKESPTLKKKLSTHVKEPDITYDDVVFRNIRHANNTLKVLDPQPPFGIPIGIFTPAPCSNYLHAIPKERFRPTFTSSKTPDVVKDDLAFRNLRKDNKSKSSLSKTDISKNDLNLLKKRAIRSLSANISNIMHKNDDMIQINDNLVLQKEGEKTRSLTNLSNGFEDNKEIFKKELKELKEIENNEFFEKFSEIKSKTTGNKKKNCLTQSKSREDIKDFDLNSSMEMNKNYNSNPLKKSHLLFSPKHLCSSVETVEKKSNKSSVVALSKFPAAAPFSENSDERNKFDFFLNENKLENLLSVLDVEYAVNDLERQLSNLNSKTVSETKLIPENNSFSAALEEFNKKFKANSLDKMKRRRNLSLSNMNEPKVDDTWGLRTNSLERRKWRSKKDENFIYFDEYKNSKNQINSKRISPKENELNSINAFKKVEKILSEEVLANEIAEFNSNNPKSFAIKKHLTCNSLPKFCKNELKSNSSLELESDVLRGKENVDVMQYLNSELPLEVNVTCEQSPSFRDTFQEVYEYNCNLNEKQNTELDKVLIENKNEKLMLSNKVPNHNLEEHSLSDVEHEFEKLHKEHSKSTKQNKIYNSELAARNGESSKESNFFLPFNEKECRILKFKNRGNTPEISSKREGEIKKDNLKTNLWLACTYALAFAFNYQQTDFLIALGTLLAVVLVIAILIL